MEQIKERLRELADPGYREFHGRLLPGTEDILGVRIPDLKRLAKEILKGDWREFLEHAEDGTYEERQLQGLVIAGAWKKMEPEELLEGGGGLVRRMGGWAGCGVFCGGERAAESGLRREVWEFVRPYFKKTGEYELRFAAVMALSHYCDGEHAEEVFGFLDEIRSEAYYVRMAVAWAVSVYYVKLPEQTMDYLKRCRLDDWTYNKALQKIIESNRVDREAKAVIRGMKRKDRKGETKS